MRLTDGLFSVLGTKVLGGRKGDIFLFAPDEIHFGRFAHPDLHLYMHIFMPIELCNSLEKDFPSFKKYLTPVTLTEQIVFVVQEPLRKK